MRIFISKLMLIIFLIAVADTSFAQFSVGAFWKKISTGGGSLNNPSGLSATPADFSVQLSWTSGGGTTTGFVVVWAAGATAPSDCTATTSERATGISASPYTVSSLVEGTQYSFRVCATDGSSLSSGVTVTSTTTSTSRYIFTTNATYKGNAIPSCDTLASAAGLPNAANYNTFLNGGANYTTSYVSGRMKLPIKNRRPAGSGGPQVAIQTSFRTTLLASLGYSQTDASVAGNAWTGTATDGYGGTASTCTSWTSGAGGQAGHIGLPTDTSSATWFSTGTSTCGTSNRVICYDSTNADEPPANPTGVTFTATSGTTGTLTWTLPSAEATSTWGRSKLTSYSAPTACDGSDPDPNNVYQNITSPYSLTGLTAGSTYYLLLCSYDDDDQLMSSGKLITFTMPATTILWISSLSTSAISSAGFTASVTYTGDSDNDYGATLYYCNNTLNPGCNPQTVGTGYGSVSMTKSGGSITGTVSGLAPATWNLYDVLNIRVVATDPDGVNGSPLNGTVTLLDVVQPPSSFGNPKVRIKSTDGSGNYNYGVTNDSDYFGRNIAAYGRIMIAGAQLDDNSLTTFPTGAEANDTAADAGAAYILRDTSAGSDWSSYVIDAYLKEASPLSNRIFGTGVAFDGTTMAVSAPSQSPRDVAGSVYIYREASANNNWSDVTLKDTITDPKWVTANYDAFGYSLAVSGRNLFVGDYNDDGKDETAGSEVATLVTDSGAVSVYYDATGDGTGYPASTPDKKLKQRNDSNTLAVVAKANFGKSIAYSGSSLIVGAPGAAGFGVAGKAIVYSCTITATSAACGPTINWAAGTNTITAKVLTTTSPFNVPDTGLTENFYGASVSIDDDAAIVGAPSDRTPNETDNAGTSVTDSGSAYVWRSANGNHNWATTTMVKKLKMRNTGGTVAPVANYQFGTSVAILGPVVAVGAPRPASTAQPQVNIFKDSDGDADYNTGSLGHHETIQAPYNWVSGQGDRFGEFVVLDNSTNVFHIFIGAFQESSTSTVLATDTNPASGTGYLSGSVFVYGP